jgi:hypothetical protein
MSGETFIAHPNGHREKEKGPAGWAFSRAVWLLTSVAQQLIADF